MIRTRQPQNPVYIERGNPLTRGLMFAMYPLYGSAYDCVSGQFAAWLSTAKTGGKATHGLTLQGGGSVVLDNTPGDSHLQFPVFSTGLDRISGVASIFGEGRCTAGFNAAAMVRSGESSNGFGLGMGFDINNNIADCPEMYVNNSIVSSSTSAILGANSGTRLERAMVTTDGANVRFYAKSGLKSTTANAATITADVTRRTYVFGDWNAGTTDGEKGQFTLILAWNRVLNAGEFAQLYVNPWQVFQDAGRRMRRSGLLLVPAAPSSAIAVIAGSLIRQNSA